MSDRPQPDDDPAPARRPAPQGILTKVSAEDRGVIERPASTPHLDFHPVEEGRTLLVSESFNTLLHGPIYADLLPLLDGRPQGDIIAVLDNVQGASDVRAALAALASRGYAVSGDHSMDRGRAAYWSALGASPRRAEQRLAAATVAVDGDGGHLSRRLGAMGVATDAESPTLSAVVCADYLDQHCDAINRRHLASGAPGFRSGRRGCSRCSVRCSGRLTGPRAGPASPTACAATGRSTTSCAISPETRRRSGPALPSRPCWTRSTG